MIRLTCPFSRLTIALLVTVLATAAIARADDSGSVSGTVVVRNTLVPIVGAIVSISDAVGSYHTKSMTDKAGHFAVIGLQPGRYTVFFERSDMYRVFTDFDICPDARTVADI